MMHKKSMSTMDTKHEIWVPSPFKNIQYGVIRKNCALSWYTVSILDHILYSNVNSEGFSKLAHFLSCQK